jgi:small subunit ribosomal protein S16e
MDVQQVQCFGRKKHAIAVARATAGKGVVKVNGYPLHLVNPAPMRYKVYEPILLLGKDKVKDLDIRVKVQGGGTTSQVYAIRQAIAKAIVAYYAKCTLWSF